MWGELPLAFYLCKHLCFPGVVLFVFNSFLLASKAVCILSRPITVHFWWQKVQVISPLSTAQRNALWLESLGSLTALPTHTCTHQQSILQPCDSVAQPSFQRREEKVQNKLPTHKWKLFLRQLRGASPHTHIYYLRLVRVCTPTVIPNNTSPITSASRLHILWACMLQRGREGWKTAAKSLEVQNAAAPAVQAQGLCKAGSGWLSSLRRAGHQEQANRTNTST